MYIPYIVSKADVNLMHGSNRQKVDLGKYGISPNKLFDYFASEKPLLMDGRPKYNPMEKYHAGICVDSPETICEGITTLRKMDEDHRNQMLQNIRDAAHAYSFENLTKKLLEVIEGA